MAILEERETSRKTRRIKIAKDKSRLTEELGQFIFFYELYLIQGENQLQALNRASSRIGVFLGAESLEDHLDNFQRLFTYTKWLVVKRLAILIERAKHFSQEDLTMDFVEISDELLERLTTIRNSRQRKLRT